MMEEKQRQGTAKHQTQPKVRNKVITDLHFILSFPQFLPRGVSYVLPVSQAELSEQLPECKRFCIYRQPSNWGVICSDTCHLPQLLSSQHNQHYPENKNILLALQHFSCLAIYHPSSFTMDGDAENSDHTSIPTYLELSLNDLSRSYVWLDIIGLNCHSDTEHSLAVLLYNHCTKCNMSL